MLVVFMAVKKAREDIHAKVSKSDLGERALVRLGEVLKDMKYLTLNRDTREFEMTDVTPDFIRSLVKHPGIGFVVENNLDNYLMEMTKSTMVKFLNKIRENKPEGSTTERSALVFDLLERYSAGIKGDERLLENNQFTKGFIGTGAFRDVWNDLISVSQVLTMSSLNDMVAFMTKNGDLDDQVVKSGLPRLRK